MEQEKLENRAKSLFTDQGLGVEEKDNCFYVKEPELEFKAVSSENFSKADLEDAARRFDKVFTDEGFEDVDEKNVSVIHKDKDKQMETPSYEIIGDVAIISELPDMEDEEAVEAILEHHPHVKTVLLKQEGLKGEFRVGEYKTLYGEETETKHTEFGCDFLVDPTKAYYSERFSTERNRIVSKIEESERVLIMFAGVGPFAIMAAKNANPSNVIGIEKNPEAAGYFQENLKENDVENAVEVIEGDVSEKMEGVGKFDRIAMPLPGSADEFLKKAFEHVEDGGLIHYYRFVEDEDWSEVIKEVKDSSEKAGRDYKIVEKTVCGERGPAVERVCIDIKVG